MDRSSTGPARQGGLERPKPEGSEQVITVWTCPICGDRDTWVGMPEIKPVCWCDSVNKPTAMEPVPYLPASRVEALEGRIGELEGVGRELADELRAASRMNYLNSDRPLAKAWREMCAALAPAEAVEEEK